MAVIQERLPAHGLYTVAEAAYVAELDSKAINNEFEQAILESASAERLVSRPSLFYVVAVKPLRAQMSTEARRMLHRGFLDAFNDGRPLVEFGYFQIAIPRIEEDVAPRLTLVEKLRDMIEIVPGVAGGEPVFTGTRIKPRLVAEMVRTGAPEAELCRDYGLSREQIELATLFDALYPRRGRPPAARRNVRTHVLPPR
ncbi:DUF433 domain-containing protein [Azospirillum thermophilum]|uniref:DUF433 domain-containing protein n=1 Tax=Azospirillum thermophilum TaxID=2202148 RepID=A0A2S2CQ73_9PROT|nr:DUF433 domain-containing protein [Azospirillum thermophilum]AWK86530.1 hypothetical protein DEW08_10015 [Azospirillum thermophilum]